MIDAVLYGALGFVIAGLLALLLVPPLWQRAVRLTTRRIEATMPMSFAEIQAEKDQLRADFAVQLRRVEVALDKAKSKAVHELVQTSQAKVRIDELDAALETLNAELEETQAAKSALEQILNRRLPAMERQSAEDQARVAETEKVDAELRYRLETVTAKLDAARKTTRAQREEIEHLRHALEADTIPVKRVMGRSDSALAKENRQLTARLSSLQEEMALVRQRDTEDYLLREEMRKLSKQILEAALPPGSPVPELEAEEPPAGADSYQLAEGDYPEAEEESPEAVEASSEDEEQTAAQPAKKTKRKSSASGSKTPRSTRLAERFAARRKTGTTGKAQPAAEPVENDPR
ncbi:hypothetical protein V6C03_00130 [Methyloligella sp. 2.7D]|uniref:hypothetical protein n=1 Tax=unclassified Methyloligella TaxID=2625955 RepID=UPI00157D1398|nr:hypothetical protein [Methyloligella sp. GL2]QKP76916.1 hypothetical protein HT051_05280 [Methyloligella sp. GL2]